MEDQDFYKVSYSFLSFETSENVRRCTSHNMILFHSSFSSHTVSESFKCACSMNLVFIVVLFVSMINK